MAAGGITLKNAFQVISNGAAGVACTRVLFDADDPNEEARRLVEIAE